MVPIVEPEVLMDGEHTAEDCYKTLNVIEKCFEELILHHVDLKGIILKPNMILAGNKSKIKISNDEWQVNFKMPKKLCPVRSAGIAFCPVGNQS